MRYFYGEQFSAYHIIGGALFGSILVLLFSIVAFSIILNTLSAIILGLSTALMTVLLIPSGVLSRYNKEIVQIERVTPYVLEELATIYLSTKSVFEAISYVSQGQYAIVSPELSRMISKFNYGYSPERMLTRFAVNQPSATLRRGLLAFVNSVGANSEGIDTVINDSHENLQRRFERLTLQWESRMMVYSGILVFLPLILILGLAVRGLADNPIILLLPVIQFILSSSLQKMMLPKNSILIGE